MNRITADQKESLTDRYHSSSEFNDHNSSTFNNGEKKASQQKYMNHFQSININATSRKPQPSHPAVYALKFGQTIENYKIQTSTIDDIFRFVQNAEQVTPLTLPLAEQPSRPNLNPHLIKELKGITNFFEQKENVEIKMKQDQLLDIESYSTILQSLGRKNKYNQGKKMLFSGSAIVKDTHPAPALVDRTVQFEQPQSPSMKKVELIMMELFAQKRRKNHMTDYFYVMELKLMELLDYILKDEPEYAYLDPSERMRLVLKNLDRFQGKHIDGQSKICLLRVFFQEFATLKKEKQHHATPPIATPVKKLEKSKPTTSSKNYPSSNKKISSNKKQTRSWQQQSFAEKRSNKSVIKDDDWLGQLK